MELSVIEGRSWAKLAVPNAEVSVALRDMAGAWIANQVGGSAQLQSLLDAILRGDAPVVEKHLARLVAASTSYFDTASPEPERFYHGLVVGLLAGLAPRYEVRSNRGNLLDLAQSLVPRSPPHEVARRHGVRPRHELAVAAELRQMCHDLEQDLLRRFAGIFRVAKHAAITGTTLRRPQMTPSQRDRKASRDQARDEW